MKLHIFIGSVFLIVLINNVDGKFNVEGLKKMTKPLREPCIQQSGVSPELVDEARNGNFADDMELKCYYMCLMQKLKVIKGGKLTVSSIKAQAAALMEDSLAARVIELIDACEESAVHDDLCEASFRYVKCAIDFDSTLNFFP
ncbi:general odorant-binding protein 83a-like [Leptopilina heterotoma]|uniref:general odorant-binding protein 83a-like n=1 Tax=Leptopilina heterotoma TaxID=63436 RepID=UPI001CA82995|nr:general odorant-binding protein 83a-like [Leptopilina heterotoma]